MANVLYASFKESCLIAGQNLVTDAIMASLIDLADYTFNPDEETYQELSPGGVTDVAKVAQVALASKTVALGVFDSADFVWLAVVGDVCEAVMLWNDTPTTPIADPLMVFYDSNITGIPVTPNGGNINGTVHSSGWFAL